MQATNRPLFASELLSQLVARPAQGPSGTLLRDLAVEHNRPAIDENIFNAPRVTKRIFVSGKVLNRRGVKERNISHHSRPQDSAIHDSDSAGGQRGHLRSEERRTGYEARGR